MAESASKGSEGAPVPTKPKTAPIIKQGQDPNGKRYGQNPFSKVKGSG